MSPVIIAHARWRTLFLPLRRSIVVKVRSSPQPWYHQRNEGMGCCPEPVLNALRISELPLTPGAIPPRTAASFAIGCIGGIIATAISIASTHLVPVAATVMRRSGIDTTVAPIIWAVSSGAMPMDFGSRVIGRLRTPAVPVGKTMAQAVPWCAQAGAVVPAFMIIAVARR